MQDGEIGQSEPADPNLSIVSADLGTRASGLAAVIRLAQHEAVDPAAALGRSTCWSSRRLHVSSSIVAAWYYLQVTEQPGLGIRADWGTVAHNGIQPQRVGPVVVSINGSSIRANVDFRNAPQLTALGRSDVVIGNVQVTAFRLLQTPPGRLWSPPAVSDLTASPRDVLPAWGAAPDHSRSADTPGRSPNRD
jgi:hypothetical protein